MAFVGGNARLRQSIKPEKAYLFCAEEKLLQTSESRAESWPYAICGMNQSSKATRTKNDFEVQLIRCIVDNRSVCWCHYRALMCNSVEDTHVGKDRAAPAPNMAVDPLWSHTRNVAVPSAMLGTKYEGSLVAECLRLLWCHHVITTGIC
jgi:hypothetical protein